MKKKILLTSFIFLSALCTFAVSFLPKKYKPLSADSPYTYIGKSFKYEHVNSLTKVYCMGEYYNYAYAAGREIYTELSGGGLLGNQSDPLAFEEYDVDYSLIEGTNVCGSGVLSVPIVRYYYYATPSLPKIIGCHDMYNDPSSVVFALEVLEDEAEHLEISDVKNAVLSYARCINTNYTEYYWELVAGDFEDDLISSFATFTVGGVEINEFFASFISSDAYNTNYGTCRTSYLNFNLPLIDCYEKGSDLIHMFACIDGIIENTGETTGDFSLIITKTSFRFLASWAGDLQSSAVVIAGDSNIGDYDFEDILSDSSYKFGDLDFYADVNAVNIAGGVDLDDVNSISSLIANYFVSILLNNPYYPRIGTFMNMVELMDGNGDSSIFKEIVYSFLGLDPSGNNIINPLNPNHHFKYIILGLGETDLNLDNVPSVQCRKYLADEFWYYCNLHRNYYDN